MKTLKDIQVLAEARDLAKLKNDASTLQQIENVCGAVGGIITRQVIEGGGRATVKASHLRMAMDTQNGVELIFDNFALSDPKSAHPLVHDLLRRFLEQ